MSKNSAQLISYILTHHNLTITQLSRLSGVSRASLYKYLKGLPIHPKKARAIASAISTKFRVVFPYEKLIE